MMGRRAARHDHLVAMEGTIMRNNNARRDETIRRRTARRAKYAAPALDIDSLMREIGGGMRQGRMA